MAQVEIYQTNQILTTIENKLDELELNNQLGNESSSIKYHSQSDDVHDKIENQNDCIYNQGLSNIIQNIQTKKYQFDSHVSDVNQEEEEQKENEEEENEEKEEEEKEEEDDDDDNNNADDNSNNHNHSKEKFSPQLDPKNSLQKSISTNYINQVQPTYNNNYFSHYSEQEKKVEMQNTSKQSLSRQDSRQESFEHGQEQTDQRIEEQLHLKREDLNKEIDILKNRLSQIEQQKLRTSSISQENQVLEVCNQGQHIHNSNQKKEKQIARVEKPFDNTSFQSCFNQINQENQQKITLLPQSDVYSTECFIGNPEPSNFIRRENRRLMEEKVQVTLLNQKLSEEISRLNQRLVQKNTEEIIVQEQMYFNSIQQLKEHYEVIIKEKDIQIIRMQHENDMLKNELNQIKSNQSYESTALQQSEFHLSSDQKKRGVQHQVLQKNKSKKKYSHKDKDKNKSHKKDEEMAIQQKELLKEEKKEKCKSKDITGQKTLSEDDTSISAFAHHYKQEISRLKQICVENEKYRLEQAQRLQKEIVQNESQYEVQDNVFYRAEKEDQVLKFKHFHATDNQTCQFRRNNSKNLSVNIANKKIINQKPEQLKKSEILKDRNKKQNQSQEQVPNYSHHKQSCLQKANSALNIRKK